MNQPTKLEPRTPVKLTTDGKIVPTTGDDPECMGEVIGTSYDAVVFVVPISFQALMQERRRAMLTEANAIGRMLGLPEVCPCCGRKEPK